MISSSLSVLLLPLLSLLLLSCFLPSPTCIFTCCPSSLCVRCNTEQEALFQISSVGYHMSVTRLPSSKDVQEEASKQCHLCPEAVRRTLSTMLDMSLLRSPTFLLLSLSGFITMMGFYVPFMYLTGKPRVHSRFS
jgi:hypothetical protein